MVGPSAIRHDRLPYNQVISDTWNEQLLLNLVRLKYRDTPFFLELGSVSTQYNLSTAIEGSADLGAGSRDDFGVETGASYSERPTVSYAPLRGERFARQLLSPVPSQSLLLLMGSGWRPERVLRTFVQQINRIPNAREASGPTPDLAPDYLEFRELSELMGDLSRRRQIELGYARGSDGNTSVVLHFAPGGGDGGDLARLRSMLGLRADAVHCKFSDGAAGPSSNAVVLVPRSLLGAMFYLSQSVESPEAHRDAGLVTETVTRTGEPFEWQNVTGDLLRIQSSKARPDAAFVRVRYRGFWFFIADRDLTSKSTFGLLGQLFNLQAGQLELPAPVLTLSVGP